MTDMNDDYILNKYCYAWMISTAQGWDFEEKNPVNIPYSASILIN